MIIKPRKFWRAVTVVFLVAILAVIIYRSQQSPIKYTERTVTIAQGDTLWQLADTYAPINSDKRDWVHKVAKLNGGAGIKKGQEIKILEVIK